MLREQLLHPRYLASFVTGLLFFALVTQKYINERFTLLERSSIGLLLLLVVIYFTKQKTTKYFLSIPATALTIVMGISLIQMPATFIIRDYGSYVLIALYAVILISFFGIGAARNGIVIGLCFLLAVNIALLVTARSNVLVGSSHFVGTSYGSNTLAASLVICIPAVLSIKTQGSKLRATGKLLVFLISSYFIFITGARTALITLVLVVTVWGLYLIAQRWRKSLPWILAFAGLSVAFVLVNFSNILSILGKSPTLSGRIPLWQAYLDKIWENPLIGYGWSFQTRIDMPLGLYISQVMGVPLSNAHDDFLNWWAQTGIIGALLFLATLAAILIFGFRFRNSSKYGLWLFFTGIAFSVNGLTELSTMYADGWFVMMISSVSISALISQEIQKSKMSKLLSYTVNLPKKEIFTNK